MYPVNRLRWRAKGQGGSAVLPLLASPGASGDQSSWLLGHRGMPWGLGSCSKWAGECREGREDGLEPQRSYGGPGDPPNIHSQILAYHKNKHYASCLDRPQRRSETGSPTHGSELPQTPLAHVRQKLAGAAERGCSVGGTHRQPLEGHVHLLKLGDLSPTPDSSTCPVVSGCSCPPYCALDGLSYKPGSGFK